MSDLRIAKLPQGFVIALSHNIAAMRRFSNLPPEEQSAIVEQARHTHSREEMEMLVESI